MEYSFFYVLPHGALKLPPTDLVDKIHRFSKSGPRGEEGQRECGERCATPRIVGLVFVYQCNQCAGICQGHTFNPIFLDFSVTISPLRKTDNSADTARFFEIASVGSHQRGVLDL